MNLAEQLHATFSSPGYRPPTLPAVGLELIALTYKPDVEFPDVIRVLERDPLLTGRILHLVQSPAYAGRVKVTSLEQALVRVGLATLREIVWEVVLGLKLFRVKGYTGSMERIRRHSTAAAYATRILARYTGYHDDQAFLGALLHDSGLAGSLIVLADAPERPELEDHWPDIHAIHEQASGRMVTLWELGDDLTKAVGKHHHSENGAAPSPLEASVTIAEYLASELGAPVLEADAKHAAVVDVSSGEYVALARKVLRIDDSMLGILRTEAEDIISTVG